MNKERLLKLALHLEKGKLGHKKFYFGHWNTDENGYPVEKGCGFMGCAIGECPIVFPNEWEFRNQYKESMPTLKVRKGPTPLRDAIQFFGIDFFEARHLFVPNKQNIILYGGKDLSGKATRKQVAKNIREFIKKKEEE